MAYITTVKPEDFVIATGQQYSVKDFVNIAAKFLEIKLHWEGEGLNEKADDDKNLVVAVKKCILDLMSLPFGRQL